MRLRGNYYDGNSFNYKGKKNNKIIALASRKWRVTYGEQRKLQLILGWNKNSELRLSGSWKSLKKAVTNIVRGVPRIHRDISSPGFVRAYISHTIVLKCDSYKQYVASRRGATPHVTSRIDTGVTEGEQEKRTEGRNCVWPEFSIRSSLYKVTRSQTRSQTDSPRANCLRKKRD